MITQKEIAELVSGWTRNAHYGNPIDPDGKKKDADLALDTLLRPGADDVCVRLELVPRYVATTRTAKVGEHNGASVTVECYLHKGSLDGPVVGHSIGIASSTEPKWLYGPAKCLACGANAMQKTWGDAWSEARAWECSKYKGGCGKRYQLSDYPEGVQVEKEHADEGNLIRYASKRALLNAVTSLGFGAYFAVEQQKRKAARKAGVVTQSQGGGGLLDEEPPKTIAQAVAAEKATVKQSVLDAVAAPAQAQTTLKPGDMIDSILLGIDHIASLVGKPAEAVQEKLLKGTTKAQLFQMDEHQLSTIVDVVIAARDKTEEWAKRQTKPQPKEDGGLLG